jgi:nonsense-mediated mRNA decay protein 3
LNEKLPLKRKDSKQLISHDQSSNVFTYKYTFSIEIPKICRNDLVILPKKLAKELGGVSRLVLCWKVAKTIGLIDLNSYNYVNMSSIQYEHYEKDMQLLPLQRYRR